MFHVELTAGRAPVWDRRRSMVMRSAGYLRSVLGISQYRAAELVFAAKEQQSSQLAGCGLLLGRGAFGSHRCSSAPRVPIGRALECQYCLSPTLVVLGRRRFPGCVSRETFRGSLPHTRDTARLRCSPPRHSSSPPHLLLANQGTSPHHPRASSGTCSWCCAVQRVSPPVSSQQRTLKVSAFANCSGLRLSSRSHHTPLPSARRRRIASAFRHRGWRSRSRVTQVESVSVRRFHVKHPSTVTRAQDNRVRPASRGQLLPVIQAAHEASAPWDISSYTRIGASLARPTVRQ